MKLVMTLLVRDEEDVLRANLDFHLAQGVDFFVITDNLSVDGSRDIIEEYVRAGVALCVEERADDYSQAEWVTRMARLAASRYRADWVINSDADEFWIGATAGEGIKADLASLDSRTQSVVVSRTNFLPVDEEGAGFFAERMIIRERESRNAVGELLPPKVCHRGFGDIDVAQGNHRVFRGGVPLDRVGRGFRILHYPLRSYRQFENKIIHGGAAYARNTKLPPHVGHAWRYLYACWQAGGLRAHYRERMLSGLVAESGLRSGDLLYDDTLLGVLRDPVGPAAVRQEANA
jgi:hypothetical protein